MASRAITALLLLVSIPALLLTPSVNAQFASTSTSYSTLTSSVTSTVTSVWSVVSSTLVYQTSSVTTATTYTNNFFAGSYIFGVSNCPGQMLGAASFSASAGHRIHISYSAAAPSDFYVLTMGQANSLLANPNPHCTPPDYVFKMTSVTQFDTDLVIPKDGDYIIFVVVTGTTVPVITIELDGIEESATFTSTSYLTVSQTAVITSTGITSSTFTIAIVQSNQIVLIIGIVLIALIVGAVLTALFMKSNRKRRKSRT